MKEKQKEKELLEDILSKIEEVDIIELIKEAENKDVRIENAPHTAKLADTLNTYFWGIPIHKEHLDITPKILKRAIIRSELLKNELKKKGNTLIESFIIQLMGVAAEVLLELVLKDGDEIDPYNFKIQGNLPN